MARPETDEQKAAFEAWYASGREACKTVNALQDVVYPTGLTVGKQVVEGGMPNQPSFDSAGDG